jgi:hypothetical protein
LWKVVLAWRSVGGRSTSARSKARFSADGGDDARAVDQEVREDALVAVELLDQPVGGDQ